MEEVKVSVIMPFYNEEKYISLAIDSILAQSYSAWELIIVNDGSTDGSEEIIKKYDDPRIRYFSYSPNRKRAHALNVGTENARGEYIVAFDADDIASTDMLENEVKYLDSHPECVCVCGARTLIDENGKIIRKKVADRYKTDTEIRAYELFGNCLSGGSSMYRHSIVRQYGLKYDEEAKIAQDYLFWIDMLPCGKFAHIGKIAYYYRTGYLSQSQKISKDNKEWHDIFKRKIFMHAWTQRGYVIDEADIKFIHDFLYKSKAPWAMNDIKQGLSTYNKVYMQSQKLNLEEKELIIRYYKKCWRDSYLNFFKIRIVRILKAILRR